MSINRRDLDISAHFITLFALVAMIFYFYFLDGWAFLYALFMLPLALCSSLCLWAACKGKTWTLVLCSSVLFIIGFGGGLAGAWDNYWHEHAWSWYPLLFLLAVAPGISIYSVLFPAR